jgi:peptide/nickel transport system permease protein
MSNNDIRGSKTFLEVVLPYVTYIGKRLLSLIPVLMIITVIIFILINLMPGDPVMAMLDPEKTAAMTIEERNNYVETMRAFLGYDKTLVERYFIWIKDTFIDGEFGYSIRFNKPVNQIIGAYIARSFKVNILRFLFLFRSE